jgi:hypothetical protein
MQQFKKNWTKRKDVETRTSLIWNSLVTGVRGTTIELSWPKSSATRGEFGSYWTISESSTYPPCVRRIGSWLTVHHSRRLV